LARAGGCVGAHDEKQVACLAYWMELRFMHTACGMHTDVAYEDRGSVLKGWGLGDGVISGRVTKRSLLYSLNV
jgi:hypothetical protein